MATSFSYKRTLTDLAGLVHLQLDLDLVHLQLPSLHKSVYLELCS